MQGLLGNQGQVMAKRIPENSDISLNAKHMPCESPEPCCAGLCSQLMLSYTLKDLRLGAPIQQWKEGTNVGLPVHTKGLLVLIYAH